MRAAEPRGRSDLCLENKLGDLLRNVSNMQDSYKELGTTERASSTQFNNSRGEVIKRKSQLGHAVDLRNQELKNESKLRVDGTSMELGEERRPAAEANVREH